LAAFALARAGVPAVSDLLPPGNLFAAAGPEFTATALCGAALSAALCLAVSRSSLQNCDAELRRWYDRACGSKVAG
jgi:hypothetical protein